MQSTRDSKHRLLKRIVKTHKSNTNKSKTIIWLTFTAGKETRMDIYSIGEMVIDFIPGEEAGSFIRNAGGAPANVAIAAARNGLETGMCCKVGEDDFGRFLVATLQKEGVKVMCEKLCEEATTTMAFVSLKADGERSFTFARKPGADMFLKEFEVLEEDITAARVVHAGSCSLSAEPVASATRKALRLGHEMGKIVSFDINYRNLMWKDDKDSCAKAVMEILPYVDILKISEEEVDMVGGEENIDLLMKEQELTAVILTLGADGARVFFDGKSFDIAGRKVKAVDATGAGDAFWGGFLSSLLLQGATHTTDITAPMIQKAMEYGNISGALCVQTKGAISSLPTREEIEQIIRREAV